MSGSPKPPTALTVLGGFLGAGKTTYLNRLLASELAEGVGIVVNDFGAICIDEQLVVCREDRLISLANGCVCCDLGENLVDALFSLREHPAKLHTIIVEASGVADPARIGRIARIGSHFKLNAIVTILDVFNVRQHVKDRYISDTIVRQIRAADLLILNKCDLVPPEVAQEISVWLEGMVPHLPKVLASQTNAPFELLLKSNSDGSASLQTTSARSVFPYAEATENVRHDGIFQAWTFIADRAFDPERLETALASLPTTIIRGKGIVSIAGGAGRSVFHLVAGQWDLTPCPHGYDHTGRTELVLIGVGPLPTTHFDTVFQNALSFDPSS